MSLIEQLARAACVRMKVLAGPVIVKLLTGPPWNEKCTLIVTALKFSCALLAEGRKKREARVEVRRLSVIGC